MPPSEIVRLDLPFDDAAPRRARATVRDAVDDTALSSPADLELVVSELVTNAVMHGAPPLELVLEEAPGGLRVEVSDGSPTPPAISTGDAGRPFGGRGMSIVADLCDQWGWWPRRPGKCVWATLPRQP